MLPVKHMEPEEIVIDEETCILLDHTNPVWPWIFWGMFIFAFIFLGVISR